MKAMSSLLMRATGNKNIFGSGKKGKKPNGGLQDMNSSLLEDDGKLEFRDAIVGKRLSTLETESNFFNEIPKFIENALRDGPINDEDSGLLFRNKLL